MNTTDVVTFYVTDQYQRESYHDVFANIPFQYSLIGSRNIPRTENNWLKAIGCLILLLSGFAVVRDNCWYVKK
jgi:hypothetical protein